MNLAQSVVTRRFLPLQHADHVPMARHSSLSASGPRHGPARIGPQASSTSPEVMARLAPASGAGMVKGAEHVVQFYES
jgi:hypothetical protein